jgi:Zn-finger nucleic acid-binding protein
MSQRAVRLITIDECQGCGGVWFERGEFDKVLRIQIGSHSPSMEQEKLLGEAATKLETCEGLTCPGCEKDLASFKLKAQDLVIDSCPRCEGLWLDKGELDTLKGMAQKRQARLPESVVQDIKAHPAPSIGVQMLDAAVGSLTRRRRRYTSADLLIDCLSIAFDR